MLGPWRESFRLAGSPSNKENERVKDKHSESKVPLLRVDAACTLVAIQSSGSKEASFRPHLEVAEIKEELASCSIPFDKHWISSGPLRARGSFGLLVMTDQRLPAVPHTSAIGTVSHGTNGLQVARTVVRRNTFYGRHTTLG